MLSIAALPLALAAQGATAPPPPVPQGPITAADSSIRIFLMTMSQGDEIYELFGHNAIWVQDPRSPVDIVYNWGVFDFHTPGFLGRFMLGDMRYIMAAETISGTLAHYQYLNRTIWAQELNLTPSEKRALVDFIQWNIQPENIQYRYNYYLDNCSTRVRDAIDRVLGGQLRAYLKSIPTDETYRSHSLRLMESEKLIVTGVDLALGRSTDRKLSADEASFLPVQLQKYVRNFTLDGGARPLVGREFVVYEAARPPEADRAPRMWKALVPIGLLLGGAVLLLGFRVRRQTWAAVLIAVLAGVFGLIGTVITLLVTITDHVAAHANENMFMLNPIWFVVAVAVPMLLLRGRARSAARWSALAGGAVALCAVLIHLVMLSRQPNWDVIGLLLPSELAIVLVALKHYRVAAFDRGASPVSASGSVKNST